jgi:hypothetical protein
MMNGTNGRSSNDANTNPCAFSLPLTVIILDVNRRGLDTRRDQDDRTGFLSRQVFGEQKRLFHFSLQF